VELVASDLGTDADGTVARTFAFKLMNRVTP
jgi:hypothetical protein